MAMIDHGIFFSKLISLLKHVIKTAAFWSYRSVISVLLRLNRHCQSIINGKEEDFRGWPGGLALSSLQPSTNQPHSTSPTILAVPVLEAPPGLHGWPNNAALNTASPPHFSPPLIPEQARSVVTLRPIVPDSEVERYDRNIFIGDNYSVFMVKKGPLDCSEELAPIAGWEPLTHPEGALFFYHQYKRVFTDADVRDPAIAVQLDKAIETAYEEARKANILLNPYVELALELMKPRDEGDKGEWGYYFADHARRTIFWFEDHTSDSLMNCIRGVRRKAHVKYALESQYWKHIELFPNKRSLTEDVVVELKEYVMCAHAGGIIFETSLASFATVDEVASMLTLMDPLMSSVNKEHEHSVWIAAGFMRLFYQAKFQNFCGQPGARLHLDQSLYGPHSYSSSTLLRAMNVILFGSPAAQSRTIHKIWVDETIVRARWNKFIDRLTIEWNGYSIFSTVVLAVNISFLAVPSVATQTPAVLLAYLSTLCTIGSLVVTLCLIGQINDSLRGSAQEVASFFVRASGSSLGLESLSIMLSLPFALLMWGMIFFATSLSIIIFGTSGIAIVSIASPVWVAIFILATWPVLASNDFRFFRLRSWITPLVDTVSYV